MPNPIDRAVTWTTPAPDELRLMRAHYVQHNFAPHAHDYFVIGLIEDGIQTFAHGRARHITTPGSLIIINPGEVHTGEAAIPTGFVYRALYPTQALFERCTAPFRAPFIPYFPGGIVHDPDLYGWLRALHQRSEHPASPLALEEGFAAFFVALIRRHAAPQVAPVRKHAAPYAVDQARAYLETHYAEPVTLGALAALVHLTPFHLTRLFTRQIGMPPHKYLENVRIRHAERLLRLGMPIAEVAYATGFSGQSHLTHTFRRFIGVTPGAYARHRA